MDPRTTAPALLAFASIALSGCGDDPQVSTNRPPGPVETVVEADRSAPIAAPGSGFGLGSGSGGGAPASSDGGSGRGSAAAGTASSGGDRETIASTASTTATESLPEPPATSIEAPPPDKDPESFFKDVESLDRDAGDTRFTEFRELCARNTDLLVRVARARRAMRNGGVAAEKAYLAADGEYAEFTERLGDYMAQRRWNDRDREVMGLLLTRSNEEALNRVREGS